MGGMWVGMISRYVYGSISTHRFIPYLGNWPTFWVSTLGLEWEFPLQTIRVEVIASKNRSILVGYELFLGIIGF